MKSVNEKEQRTPIIAYLGMTLVQLIFYLIPGIIAYWIVILNWKMLIICGMISFLQNALIKGPNERYAKFLNRVFKIGEYASF